MLYFYVLGLRMGMGEAAVIVTGQLFCLDAFDGKQFQVSAFDGKQFSLSGTNENCND